MRDVVRVRVRRSRARDATRSRRRTSKATCPPQNENLQNWQSLLIEHAYFLLPLCFDALWQTRDVPLLSWIVAHNYLLRCKLTEPKETNALRDIYDFVSKENPSRDRTAHWWFEKLKGKTKKAFDTIIDSEAIAEMFGEEVSLGRVGGGTDLFHE